MSLMFDSLKYFLMNTLPFDLSPNLLMTCLNSRFSLLRLPGFFGVASTSSGMIIGTLRSSSSIADFYIISWVDLGCDPAGKLDALPLDSASTCDPAFPSDAFSTLDCLDSFCNVVEWMSTSSSLSSISYKLYSYLSILSDSIRSSS